MVPFSEYIEWKKLHRMRVWTVATKRKETHRSVSRFANHTFHIKHEGVSKYIYVMHTYDTICACFRFRWNLCIHFNDQNECNEEGQTWQNTCTICILLNALFFHSMYCIQYSIVVYPFCTLTLQSTFSFLRTFYLHWKFLSISFYFVKE